MIMHSLLRLGYRQSGKKLELGKETMNFNATVIFPSRIRLHGK